jgi:predicted esterase
MPVAITAGGQDTVVPAASVFRLAEAIKKLRPGNLLLVHREEGGHSTNYEDSKAAFDFVLGKVIRTSDGKDSKR